MQTFTAIYNCEGKTSLVDIYAETLCQAEMIAKDLETLTSTYEKMENDYAKATVQRLKDPAEEKEKRIRSLAEYLPDLSDQFLEDAVNNGIAFGEEHGKV